jgi:cyclopropane fatty-acyl-phospholipid synthase-like methyltransferase
MSSIDYDQSYYERYKGQPYAREEPWLSHFGQFAHRVVADLAPNTALDIGCAMGLLVEALRDRGVEAWGLDISEYAIKSAREDIREFVSQGSATDPLDRRYDVVTCIEVLEHLTPGDAAKAVANIASHTDDVIFSSTPDDFREQTHLNVRGPDYWAGLFAQHGMFRDVDYQADYVASWAVRFRRTGDPVPRIVQRYERWSDRLARENHELRAVMAENSAATLKAEAEAAAALEEAAESRQALTAAREEQATTSARLAEARDEIAAMQATAAWRAAERLRRLRRR